MKKNKKDKKIKIDDISKDIIAALKKEIDSDAATGAYGTFFRLRGGTHKILLQAFGCV